MRPVEAGVFHADRLTARRTEGQTDRHDNANIRFSQFCKRAQHRILYVYKGCV
jgi:hypothetical protein